MPFTVSCTACATRFLLGDDLFRRKVSGNIVTVKCRNCDAEISVDARDADTMPSHESPRRAPLPPRPKAKEQMALIVPKPISDEARSIWDSESEQTVSIGGKPAPPSPEPEFVDFEEIPASSSDAPSLNTLTHEATRVHPPRRNKPPDEFLVNLSAGTGGILGAPSIDVSALTAPAAPASFETLDIEPEPSTERAGTVPLARHAGTVPLFDMSAVLPAANPNATIGSASSAPMQIDIDVGPLRANAAVSTGKVRERRHVIAPQDAPAAQKSRRSGALVWLAVAALAAGVLVVVGLRGHRAPQPVAAEPQPAIEHPTTVLSNAVPVVESTPSAAPVPEASAQEVASAAPSVAAPSTAAATPTLANNSAKTLQPKAAPSEPAPAPKAEAAVAVAAVATEQPTAPSEPAAPKAPVVIHNALPPAAPGTEFDRSAAVSALKSAAVQASSCRKDGDPSGSATLTITFAPSGRVTSATIQGPPFAGTPTGGCIASMMRHAQIPSFDGDRVTVTKTVVIE